MLRAIQEEPVDTYESIRQPEQTVSRPTALRECDYHHTSVVPNMDELFPPPGPPLPPDPLHDILGRYFLTDVPWAPISDDEPPPPDSWKATLMPPPDLVTPSSSHNSLGSQVTLQDAPLARSSQSRASRKSRCRSATLGTVEEASNEPRAQPELKGHSSERNLRQEAPLSAENGETRRDSRDSTRTIRGNPVQRNVLGPLPAGAMSKMRASPEALEQLSSDMGEDASGSRNPAGESSSEASARMSKLSSDENLTSDDTGAYDPTPPGMMLGNAYAQNEAVPLISQGAMETVDPRIQDPAKDTDLTTKVDKVLDKNTSDRNLESLLQKLTAPPGAGEPVDDANPIPFGRESTAKMEERRAQQPNKSLLSEKLRAHSTAPVAPLLTRYASVAAAASEASSMRVLLYFPTLRAPDAQHTPYMLDVHVRSEATMEELIGYGLYCYMERGWKPALDADVAEEDRDTRPSTLGWTLRIVDDGVMDEDYPVLDRNAVLARFGGDEFAICPATQAQVMQHCANMWSSTGGKPTVGRGKARAEPATGASASSELAPPVSVPRLGAVAATLPSDGVLVRIAVLPGADEVQYTTTVHVATTERIGNLIENVCKKRQLGSPTQYALVFRDTDVVLPPESTVASVQGRRELALVTHKSLREHKAAQPAVEEGAGPAVPEQPKYTTAMDLISNYKVRMRATVT